MNRINNQDTRVLINEMYQILNPKKKLTVEGLVFGEDGEEEIGNQTPMQDEMPQEDMAQQQQMNNREQGMPQTDENPLDGDPEITKLITNIRVQTLQGLTKLAQHPETAQYELLKKIFLLVDKSVEDKIDPEK